MLVAVVGADPQNEWGRYKRVLSKPGLRQRRASVRRFGRQARQDVHTASRYVGFVAPPCGEGDADLAFDAIVDGAPAC